MKTLASTLLLLNTFSLYAYDVPDKAVYIPTGKETISCHLNLLHEDPNDPRKARAESILYSVLQISQTTINISDDQHIGDTSTTDILLSIDGKNIAPVTSLFVNDPQIFRTHRKINPENFKTNDVALGKIKLNYLFQFIKDQELKNKVFDTQYPIKGISKDSTTENMYLDLGAILDNNDDLNALDGFADRMKGEFYREKREEYYDYNKIFQIHQLKGPNAFSLHLTVRCFDYSEELELETVYKKKTPFILND